MATKGKKRSTPYDVQVIYNISDEADFAPSTTDEDGFPFPLESGEQCVADVVNVSQYNGNIDVCNLATVVQSNIVIKEYDLTLSNIIYETNLSVFIGCASQHMLQSSAPASPRASMAGLTIQSLSSNSRPGVSSPRVEHMPCRQRAPMIYELLGCVLYPAPSYISRMPAHVNVYMPTREHENNLVSRVWVMSFVPPERNVHLHQCVVDNHDFVNIELALFDVQHVLSVATNFRVVSAAELMGDDIQLNQATMAALQQVQRLSIDDDYSSLPRHVVGRTTVQQSVPTTINIDASATVSRDMSASAQDVSEASVSSRVVLFGDAMLPLPLTSTPVTASAAPPRAAPPAVTVGAPPVHVTEGAYGTRESSPAVSASATKGTTALCTTGSVSAPSPTTTTASASTGTRLGSNMVSAPVASATAPCVTGTYVSSGSITDTPHPPPSIYMETVYSQTGQGVFRPTVGEDTDENILLNYTSSLPDYHAVDNISPCVRVLFTSASLINYGQPWISENISLYLARILVPHRPYVDLKFSVVHPFFQENGENRVSSTWLWARVDPAYWLQYSEELISEADNMVRLELQSYPMASDIAIAALFEVVDDLLGVDITFNSGLTSALHDLRRLCHNTDEKEYDQLPQFQFQPNHSLSMPMGQQSSLKQQVLTM